MGVRCLASNLRATTPIVKTPQPQPVTCASPLPGTGYVRVANQSHVRFRPSSSVTAGA
jgi:hypothetical protein